MSDNPKPKTITYFRVMVEDSDGTRWASPLTFEKWESGILNQMGKSLVARTHVVDGDKIIGRAFSPEDQAALRIMKPRDESSWLSLLKYDALSTDDETEPVQVDAQRDLVEMSVITFVPGCNNVFGLIRGSQSAPTQKDVAGWFTRAFPPGDNKFFVAVPCVSHSMKQRLKQVDGAASTTVRLPSRAAHELNIAGADFGSAIAQLEEARGEMMVTLTLSVPPGTSRGHEVARQQLQQDTVDLLENYPGIERLLTNLVVSDRENRRREEVNLLEQRLTAKSVIPTKNDDGEVIREDSAVRQIVAKSQERDLLTALQEAEEQS